MVPGVRHFAFQKRDGTYFIALWVEEPSYDPPGQRGAVVQGRDVTLRLPREMQVVRSHLWHADGRAEARPVRTVTSSVNVHVSDAMQVIEIAPAEAMAGGPGMPGPLAATVRGLDVHRQWHRRRAAVAPLPQAALKAPPYVAQVRPGPANRPNRALRHWPTAPVRAPVLRARRPNSR